MATAQHPLWLGSSRRSAVYTFAVANVFLGLSFLLLRLALRVFLSFALTPGNDHGGALLMVVQAIWVLSTVCHWHAAVATDFLDTKHPRVPGMWALAASPSVWLSALAVALAAAAAVDDNRNTALALCTRLAMLLAPSINILSLMLEKRTDFSNLDSRFGGRKPLVIALVGMMLISIFGLSSSSLSDAASVLTVAVVAFYATEYSLITVKALDSDVGPSSGIQVQWSCLNIAKLVWWLHRVSAILGFCTISLTMAALVFKYNHPDDLIGDTSAYYLTALAVVVGAISISFASDIVELRVCRRHCDRSESGGAAAALVDSEAASDSGSDSGPEADAAEIAPLTAPRAVPIKQYTSLSH